MKYIELTNGDKTIIDDEDYEEVSKYKWRKDSLDNHVVRTFGPHKGRRLIRLHRQIMKAEVGQIIDHINGNVLDNRKENLRIATKSQNGMNRSKQKNNKSGYKGVSWSNQHKRWIAQLTLNGKRVLNKLFKTKEEAAKAYNEAAIKYFGEFAQLNNI